MTRQLGQASGAIVDMITAAALRYSVDPNLALAQARAESNLNQAAISPVGAIGVMQLMPATAKWLGVDPYNLTQNIDGGVRYLAMMLQQFGGDVQKALAAYNWGPGNLTKSIAKYGGEWISHLPAETSGYIARITAAVGPYLPGGEEGPSGDTIAILIVGAILIFLVVN